MKNKEEHAERKTAAPFLVSHTINYMQLMKKRCRYINFTLQNEDGFCMENITPAAIWTSQAQIYSQTIPLFFTICCITTILMYSCQDIMKGNTLLQGSVHFQ